MDSFDVVRAVSYLKKQLEGKNLESINTGAEIIQLFSSNHPRLVRARCSVECSDPPVLQHVAGREGGLLGLRRREVPGRRQGPRHQQGAPRVGRLLPER